MSDHDAKTETDGAESASTAGLGVSGRPAGISDLQWAQMQTKRQNYYIGDVVKFHGGGIGLINGVSRNGGWPPSYSTEPVSGHEYRRDAKLAWHYEGDFQSLVAPFGVRHLLTPNLK